MSSKSKRDIGNEAEELAAAFLEGKGYFILDRNYYFERAEVDIVALNPPVITFVEVKMRANTNYGQPEEFVSQTKIDNIRRAAEAWIYERKMDGYPVRFDVIAIVQNRNEAAEIKHLEDAVSYQLLAFSIGRFEIVNFRHGTQKASHLNTLTPKHPNTLKSFLLRGPQ